MIRPCEIKADDRAECDRDDRGNLGAVVDQHVHPAPHRRENDHQRDGRLRALPDQIYPPLTSGNQIGLRSVDNISHSGSLFWSHQFATSTRRRRSSSENFTDEATTSYRGGSPASSQWIVTS